MTQTIPKANMRRPVSAIICTAIFAIDLVMAFTSVLRAANRPIDLYFVIQTALITTGFLCLLFFSRSQITYYITSAALLALLFKVLYYFVSDVRSVRQDPMLVSIAVGVLGLGLCLLFWRFAFARPSRLYYGFIKTKDVTAV